MGKKYYSNMTVHLQVKVSDPEDFAKVLKDVIPEYMEDGLYYRKVDENLYDFDGIEIPGANGEYPKAIKRTYEDGGGFTWDDASEWFCENYEEFYKQLTSYIEKASEGKYSNDKIKLVAKGIGELLDEDYNTVKEFQKKNSEIFTPVNPFEICGGLVPFSTVRIEYPSNKKNVYVKFPYFEKRENGFGKEVKFAEVSVPTDVATNGSSATTYEALGSLYKDNPALYDKVMERFNNTCAPVNFTSVRALDKAIKAGKNYETPSSDWVCVFEPEMERE